jgi:hypothetical protein
VLDEKDRPIASFLWPGNVITHPGKFEVASVWRLE